MLTASQCRVVAFYREDHGYVCPKCAAEITTQVDVEKSYDGLGSWEPVIQYRIDQLSADYADMLIKSIREVEMRELSWEERDKIYQETFYPCDSCDEPLD